MVALPAAGHFVVLGTAGSGKTTMSVHRAAYLGAPSTDHSGRVALVTYNRALLAYFGHLGAHSLPNVDVLNYHRFALGYLKSIGEMGPDWIVKDDEVRAELIRVALAKVRGTRGTTGVLGRDDEFFFSELRYMAQHGLQQQKDYLEADRIGRGRALDPSARLVVLEQTAKYGIRAVLCNQNPERLTPATLNALTTNRSHLLTTALNSHAAGMIAREWGGDPDADAITHLPHHTFLAQLTHRGELTNPFLIKTLAVTDLYPDAYRPEEMPSVQPTIEQASVRREAHATIARLDTLDEQIADYLASRRRDEQEAPNGGEESVAPPVVRDLPAPVTGEPS